MRPISIPPLTPTPREPLDRFYRTTPVPRLRTRAQMILLAAEQGLKVPQIAAIVRESEATVLRWLKRYLAESLEGLQDAPRHGRPSDLTEAYRAALLAAVRRRLGVTVLTVDAPTAGRCPGRAPEDSRLR